MVSRRSIGISAFRSLVFNNELSSRVDAATWNELVPGDVANLDGSDSVFDVEEVTPQLRQRCTEMDIHPCGSLPAFEGIGVKAAYHPLRVRVCDLSWSFDESVLWVDFSLGRGSFATAVLRELFR